MAWEGVGMVRPMRRTAGLLPQDLPVHRHRSVLDSAGTGAQQVDPRPCGNGDGGQGVGEMKQVERVLRMLREAGPLGVTNYEFYRCYLPRFGGRIFELRTEGYVIDVEFVKTGCFRYTLQGGDRPVGQGPVTDGSKAACAVAPHVAARPKGEDEMFSVIHSAYGTTTIKPREVI